MKTRSCGNDISPHLIIPKPHRTSNSHQNRYKHLFHPGAEWTYDTVRRATGHPGAEWTYDTVRRATGHPGAEWTYDASKTCHWSSSPQNNDINTTAAGHS